VRPAFFDRASRARGRRRYTAAMAFFRCVLFGTAALAAGCGAKSGLIVGGRESASDAGASDAGRGEVCDGRDDDGDGRVDEAIAPLSCGREACMFEVPACVDGRPSRCPSLPIRAEVCNRLDDDCDGDTDEGLGFAELGPPRVVRSTEGTTGDCAACQWAAGAQLWHQGDRMLAVWRMGFDGSLPRPNAFFRRLDADAQPIGEVQNLFDEPVPNGLRLAPASDGRAVLAFCGRESGDDIMTSALVGEAGDLVRDLERREPRTSCGAGLPDGIFGAERFFFAWTDNSDDGQISLDVADASGDRLLSRTLLDAGGDLAAMPRFAVNGDRVAMVAGHRPEIRESRLLFYVFDRTGAPIGPPADIAPIEGPESFYGEPLVAASGSGWLVIAQERASDDASGRIVIELDRDGRVVRGPERLEPERRYVEWAIVAAPRGFFVAGSADFGDGSSGLFAARLDERGSITDEWRDSTDGIGLSGIDADARDGRYYFTYAGTAADSIPNRVVVRVFGCTP
jgi:hypothetical protein